MGFGDFATAAAARDLIAGIAEKTVDRMRPEPKIGQVVSVDTASLTAECIFTGDEVDTIRARFYAYNQPIVGDIVRVVGKAGSRWISDVITNTGNYNRLSDGSGNWGPLSFKYDGTITGSTVPEIVTCSSTVNLTAATTRVDITGVATTITSPGTAAAWHVEVAADCRQMSTAVPTLVLVLDVEGVEQAGNLNFQAPAANTRSTQFQQWNVSGLAAGDHTFKLRGYLASVAGNYNVYADHTNMSIRRIK